MHRNLPFNSESKIALMLCYFQSIDTNTQNIKAKHGKESWGLAIVSNIQFPYILCPHIHGVYLEQNKLLKK